jgi:hypothetical protein
MKHTLSAHTEVLTAHKNQALRYSGAAKLPQDLILWRVVINAGIL